MNTIRKKYMDNQLLERMVSISSIYPDEYRLGEFLRKYLRAHGFTVHTQRISENRFNIFAVKGSGTKSILFYGHLDTVPIGNVRLWTSDPFALIERRGRYYGLGVYDMKAGIAAFLHACIHSTSYTKLFLAVDEEYISIGAWAAVQHQRKFFSDVELIISAEPNFDIGTHGILRGRTGRFIFTVNFQGKPAHVAQYRDGVDAISMLGKFITDFYNARERLFLSQGTFAQVRGVSGEAVGMSVCGSASVEVEVLSGYKDTLDEIYKRLQSLTYEKVQLKARQTPYLPGYYFTTFPYQKIIGDIIRRNTGKAMELHSRMSVGDDNVLATLGIPVITWGPDGGNAHIPNEYVSRSSLETISNMFHEFLENS